MTKREYKAYRANWTKALSEGRVVRVGNGLTAYPTIEARDKAIAGFMRDGLPFTIATDQPSVSS
jgi:hypothetical protein